MSQEGLVKIKTHNGVDIFYNVYDARVYITAPDTGDELRFNYVFEAERRIDEPVWEDCDLKGYVKEGYPYGVLRVKATKRDIKSGKPYWVWVDGYDRGKSLSQSSIERVIYPDSQENRRVFAEFQAQEEVVSNEQLKSRQIIERFMMIGAHQGRNGGD